VYYSFGTCSVARPESNLGGSWTKLLQPEYGEIFMVETTIEESLACLLDGRKDPWFASIITISTLA
jgi:hypothetical protein